MATISVQNYYVSGYGYGYALQRAVNTALAGDVVVFPSGRLPWVVSGESGLDSKGWRTVTVPHGIDITAAPTTRTTCPYCGRPNMWATAWATVLYMPYEVPGGDITDPSDPTYSQQASPIPTWMNVSGGVGTSPVQVSEIMMEGWRYTHPTSRSMSTAINFGQTIDFRLHHCWLQDIAAGVWVGDGEGNYPNQQTRGVIDHCKIVNTNGLPYDPAYPMTGDDPAYNHRTVGYGVGIGVVGTSTWNPNPTTVWGKYETDSAIGTVYIEDCYFSKWRHNVSSGHGAHYVFRHCDLDADFAFGTLDCHGQYANVGTRAVEIYNNRFLPCMKWTNPTNWWGIGMFHRGGAALIYNNTVNSPYLYFVELSGDGPQDPVQDTYLWGNVLDAGIQEYSDAVGYTYGKDYTTQPPTLSGNTYTLPALTGKSAYQYTPYPYPHPLTLGDVIPTNPILTVNSTPTGIPFTIRKVA